MLLRGEALISTFTLGFSVSGERGDWKVSVTGPSGIASENETQEDGPYDLLDEMLTSTFETCCRRFPQRAPVRATR
jgi:hypothetical protein